MSAPDRLPDEALDGLLDGSPSDEAVGTPLASYLSQLRDVAETSTPAPSDELQAVLAEGLDAEELAAGGSLTRKGQDEAPSALGWRRRGRMVWRALATKFAALGLLAKTATAGVAATVAASSAGAAGVLPPPMQDSFDEAVGRQVQEAPAEQGDEGDAEGSETDAEVPSTPANTADTPPLDTDVPGDATDGEPGVEGGDIARDASDGASDAADDNPSDDAIDGTPAEDAPAQDAPDGAQPGDTPSDDQGDEATDSTPAPDEVPPTETPTPEQEPGSASEGPADGDPRD